MECCGDSAKICTFVTDNRDEHINRQTLVMAKEKKVYVCDYCGQESLRWVGRCPSCQQWNTMKEMTLREEKAPSGAVKAALKAAGRAGVQQAQPVPVAEIHADEEPRMDMGDRELNRVLGGGLVPGSLVLLGGEPGIGKSTLVLQTVLRLKGRRVLYVSGEESARQLKLRADRLMPSSSSQQGECSGSDLLVLTETSLEQIFVQIEQTQPSLVVIDSIQTIQTETVDSSPGSLTQIRECAASLLKYAKCGGASILLIGHINKEGTLAGPKVLEHIVDTVLQFEGDQHYMYRILRSIKNRFGSTSELGIYEMRHDGLQLSNALFNRMLDEAVSHSADPQFNAMHYFLHHQDIEVARVAAEMSEDRYHLTEQSQPAMQDITPEEVKRKEESRTEALLQQTTHLLLDFRMDYVEQRLRDLKQQIAAAAADRQRLMELMQEFKQMQDIRNSLAKQLGSNIII